MSSAGGRFQPRISPDVSLENARFVSRCSRAAKRSDGMVSTAARVSAGLNVPGAIRRPPFADATNWAFCIRLGPVRQTCAAAHTAVLQPTATESGNGSKALTAIPIVYRDTVRFVGSNHRRRNACAPIIVAGCQWDARVFEANNVGPGSSPWHRRCPARRSPLAAELRGRRVYGTRRC